MLFRSLAAIAAFVAFGSSAAAETARDGGGLYAKIYGGSSTLTDTNVQVSGTVSKGKFSSGTMVGGAIGYDYEGPWRSELEYSYRSSSLKRLGGATASNSDYASTSIMVNGLYEFNQAGNFQPYVGLGIGLTREVDFDLNAGPTANRGQYSRSSTFAVQGIVGVEVDFADDWSGFGELRTFSVNSPSLKGGGRTLKADYRTTDIVIGIARRF